MKDVMRDELGAPKIVDRSIFQQVELSLNSNVDPYFRADVNLVLTTEGIEIEEASMSQLEALQKTLLRAGR